MLPVLSSETPVTIIRPAPLFWHWAGSRGVREENWKLVWDKSAKKWELYDLAVDRTETRDLAAEQVPMVARLADKWFAWASLTGVKY